MSAAHPTWGRSRLARPVAWARWQVSRRPQWWGRLLAAGVTVVMVAALVPAARADGDSGETTLVPVDPPAEDAFTEAQTSEQESSAVVATDDDVDAAAWQQAEAPVADDGGRQEQRPGDLERLGATGDRLVRAQQDLDEVQQEIDQAEGLLEELEAGTPPASDAAAGAGGDVGGEAGSGGGERTGEQGQQPTGEPVVVAEVRPKGQPLDGRPDLTAKDIPGVTGQGAGGNQDAARAAGAGTGDEPEPASGEQGEPGAVGQDQAGGGLGGCASGCSTQPPGTGGATVAAAGGWWGWGRDLVDRVRGVLGGRQPRRLLELEPTVVMDLIQGDLARVSDLQQQQLAAEGGTPSQSDLDAARRLLDRARGAIERLGPQVEETPEGGERFAALAQQAEGLTQAVGDPARQGELMLDIDINDPTVDRNERERLMTQ